MDKKDISYVAFESITARLERTIEKLWILVIILVVLFVGSNCAWIYYEHQFEDSVTTVMQEVEADADSGSDLNLNTIGGDYHGGESESTTNSND